MPNDLVEDIAIHGPTVLSLNFVVRDDLPSERVAQYRQLVIDALENYRLGDSTTTDQHEMISRMLWDWIDDRRAICLLHRKRSIARRLDAIVAGDEELDGESSRLEDELTGIEDRLSEMSIEGESSIRQPDQGRSELDLVGRLVAALTRCVNAADARENRAGDPCGMLDAKAELAASSKHAKELVAKALCLR